MAARAPDRPSDPVRQEHRQQGADADECHEDAGRPQGQVGQGAASQQHDVAGRQGRHQRPGAESEPGVEPARHDRPEDAAGVRRPGMRWKPVGQGRVGGIERGQRRDREQAPGQKGQRREVPELVAGQRRLFGGVGRPGSVHGPRGAAEAAPERGARGGVTGRDARGDRSIDVGHGSPFLPVARRGRGSTATLQAGWRPRGGHPRRPGGVRGGADDRSCRWCRSPGLVGRCTGRHRCGRRVTRRHRGRLDPLPADPFRGSRRHAGCVTIEPVNACPACPTRRPPNLRRSPARGPPMTDLVIGVAAGLAAAFFSAVSYLVSRQHGLAQRALGRSGVAVRLCGAHLSCGVCDVDLVAGVTRRLGSLCGCGRGCYLVARRPVRGSRARRRDRAAVIKM